MGAAVQQSREPPSPKAFLAENLKRKKQKVIKHEQGSADVDSNTATGLMETEVKTDTVPNNNPEHLAEHNIKQEQATMKSEGACDPYKRKRKAYEQEAGNAKIDCMKADSGVLSHVHAKEEQDKEEQDMTWTVFCPKCRSPKNEHKNAFWKHDGTNRFINVRCVPCSKKTNRADAMHRLGNWLVLDESLNDLVTIKEWLLKRGWLKQKLSSHAMAPAQADAKDAAKKEMRREAKATCMKQGHGLESSSSSSSSTKIEPTHTSKEEPHSKKAGLAESRMKVEPEEANNKAAASTWYVRCKVCRSHVHCPEGRGKDKKRDWKKVLCSCKARTSVKNAGQT